MLLTIAGLGLMCSTLAAQTLVQNPPAGTPVPGELIVKLDPNVKPQDLAVEGVLVQGVPVGMELRETLSELASIFLFSYDDVALDGEEVVRSLSELPSVVAAQLNHYVEDRATPNDPQFGSQWHHIDGSDNDIDSELAWDITTGGATANGDRIVVAVLEGGGANYLSLIHI